MAPGSQLITGLKDAHPNQDLYFVLKYDYMEKADLYDVNREVGFGTLILNKQFQEDDISKYEWFDVDPTLGAWLVQDVNLE